MISLKPKKLKSTPLKKITKSKKSTPQKKPQSTTSLKIPEIKGFTTLAGIQKLRIAVITIFSMMTIAFALAITSEFAFSVALILLSYLGLLILVIKLFLIKKI